MDVNINDLLDVTSQFTAGKLVADITFRIDKGETNDEKANDF
jgi:hypothetical protein